MPYTLPILYVPAVGATDGGLSTKLTSSEPSPTCSSPSPLICLLISTAAPLCSYVDFAEQHVPRVTMAGPTATIIIVHFSLPSLSVATAPAHSIMAVSGPAGLRKSYQRWPYT